MAIFAVHPLAEDQERSQLSGREKIEQRSGAPGAVPAKKDRGLSAGKIAIVRAKTLDLETFDPELNGYPA